MSVPHPRDNNDVIMTRGRAPFTRSDFTHSSKFARTASSMNNMNMPNPSHVRTASAMMMPQTRSTFSSPSPPHFSGRSPAATRSHMMMDQREFAPFERPATTCSQMPSYDYYHHPAMTHSNFLHGDYNLRSSSPGPFTAAPMLMDHRGTRSRFMGPPATKSQFPEPVFSPNRRF